MPPPTRSPSSPMRTLLLTEATLKLLSGTLFLVSPSAVLARLSPPPHTRVPTLLIRLLGTQTLAFAVPLFLAAGADMSGPTRRVVYWACLARETFLAVGLVGMMARLYLDEGGRGEGGWEGVDERSVEEGMAGEKRGMVDDARAEGWVLFKGMGWWVGELVPFVVGRAWVLGWRGAWFD
ncbi:hypothetical protein DPSP01_000753 [Paraphaeosphaeria sporulosa]